jgi:beta-galactosidase
MKQKYIYFLILFILLFGLNLNAKESTNINSSWKFTKTSVTNAEQISFDDASWDNINLPHTWNAFDGQDGGGNYFRGIGWYRKTIEISTKQAKKTTYLKIGAANTSADVYINGQFAGKHTGGYSAFMFDISRFLNFGEKNTIAIKVDNSTEIICPPISADFTFYGGITRNVELIVSDKVHFNINETIDNDLLKSPIQVAQSGIFLKQSNVSESSATLDIVSMLQNNRSKSVTATIEIKIKDASGKTVKKLSDKKRIPANSSLNSSINTTISNPHLWDGINNPYLYKVEAKLKVNCKTVDSLVQPLGFRYFTVDADKGFFLNGKSYPLRGICLHEEKKDKGRAVSDADRKEALDLLLETGANYLRLSHYQHGDFSYNYLDSMGIVCWAEIPVINTAGTSQEDNLIYQQNASSMMYELVRQQYNHPSIIFWGLSNEINYKHGVKPLATIEKLNKIVKSEDSYRLSAVAAMYPENETNWVSDVYSNNRYDGWYYGKIADFGTTYDTLHMKYPTKKIGVSEYGVGANITQHEWPVVKPNEGGQYHPEEYQNLYHEEYLKMINARPFIWSSSVWAAFDFGSDLRDEGTQPGINDKGLITFDRSVKKDAFYWYKANWNKKEAVVYISSRRYNIRQGIYNTVKIYSNCASVTLKLNGTIVGTKTSTDHIFQWDNVTMLEGANQIEASGTFNGTDYSDIVTWNCKNASSLTEAPAVSDAKK